MNSCLEIVRKYNNALLSGYLDPEEALPSSVPNSTLPVLIR